MELIHVITSGFVTGTVDCNTVPDLILNDEHSKFLKLFSKIFDVKANDSIIQLYVRPMVEYF